LIVNINITRLKVLAYAALYFGALQWAYPNVVSPLFAYQGMIFRELPMEIMVFQWVLAMLPAFILPYNVTRPSHYQWWILYLTVIVPLSLISFHVVNYEGTQLPLYLMVTVGCFMLMVLSSALPKLKLPKVKISPQVFWFLLGCITVFTYAGLIATLGIPKSMPTAETVYDLRSEAKPMLENSLPVIFRYLYFWQGLVFNPYILIVGLARKNPLLIAVGIGLQLLMFAITTLRIFFLNNLLLVGMFFLISFARRSFGLAVLKAFTGLVLASILWWSVDNTAVGPRVLLERWILMGGQLSTYYYDYYSENPPDALAHTLLGAITTSPYTLPPNKTIGNVYFTDQTNAPSAIWADGYGNLGWIGMILASIVAVIIMWVMDSVFVGRDAAFAVLITTIGANSFASQGVLSSLLTGGIVPVLLLGLTSPNIRISQRKYRRSRRETPADGTRLEEATP
jgi:hypothetical protein